MDVTDILSGSFEDISWLPVVVATLATFVIGGVWYHEKVLGNRWMKAVGLSKNKVESANMAKVFGSSLGLSFLTAVFLAVFADILEVNTALNGGLLGAVISLVFVVASLGTQYAFAQRSFELFAIDSSYIVINFVVMGAIIGGWQ